MSVGRVYAVKTASRLPSWPRVHTRVHRKFAQFQQSRLLVVCCVCATLERTKRASGKKEREGEKRKKKHVGIRSAPSTYVYTVQYVNHFIRAPHFLNFLIFNNNKVFFFLLSSSLLLIVGSLVLLLCVSQERGRGP